ncbi:hypothetical protein [Caulobacter sp. 17J80-11]|uniref:hypothetical protein n=1 Tax=Caulobacter sp. 17J80-11 TaxID=2763502 RepID=UPI00165378EE|nr:hypothetical protein [Caulobacter sp. 17J80-11]MBC6981323.1 hypothetical protein [Caulobacter sp. 17J80-11]
MSTSAASERRFLSQDELEVVGKTHYPAVADLDADALRETRKRLRDLRDKARTQSRDRKRTVARAKGGRGSAAEATKGEPHARRKQIFSQALQRTNRQLQRLEHAEARAVTVAGKRRALAMVRRAEQPARPASRTAGRGMRANPSLRRAEGVPPDKVGSVSAAGRRAQAKRDAG